MTNAYTESLNNLIRVMNRLGRGYSFEALRAKILFTEGVHKIKRPRFERKVPEYTMGRMVSFHTGRMDDMLPSTRNAEREINYGADISTLARLIESGEL